MADLGEEKNGVFGGVEVKDLNQIHVNEEPQENVKEGVFGGVETEKAGELPVKIGFWAKFKAFWLQDVDWNKDIKVELTPYQQKVEDEINDFLHQEVTWKKFHDFLFQDVTIGKKKEVA